MKEQAKSSHQAETAVSLAEKYSPRPEFTEAVRIVALALQKSDRDFSAAQKPKVKNLGVLRSLAIRAVIMVPAVGYFACGGGGEGEKPIGVSTSDNTPTPQREIDMDILKEKVAEKRVYIDTFTPTKDKIQKIVAELGPHFQVEPESKYIPPPKPPAPEPVQPVIHPPPEVRPGGGNKIVLTFDDSDGSGGIVSGILDTLSQYNAKAIFFPTGSWAAGGGASYVERMKNEGHLVCNHTYSHANLTALSSDGVRYEISNGAGVGSCNLLRPPYGAHNSYVDSIAASLGYSIYMWDIDTRDWARRYDSGDQEILNIVLSQARPGAVVLMHMHVDQTLEALPRMLEGLKTAGYELSW